jgi:hypothetical protein
MNAGDFDKQFDRGNEGIPDDPDSSAARCSNLEHRRIHADFPSWIGESLDREVARSGVTRQPNIKVWLAERLNAG